MHAHSWRSVTLSPQIQILRRSFLPCSLAPGSISQNILTKNTEPNVFATHGRKGTQCSTNETKITPKKYRKYLLLVLVLHGFAEEVCRLFDSYLLPLTLRFTRGRPFRFVGVQQHACTKCAIAWRRFPGITRRGRKDVGCPGGLGFFSPYDWAEFQWFPIVRKLCQKVYVVKLGTVGFCIITFVVVVGFCYFVCLPLVLTSSEWICLVFQVEIRKLMK